MTRKRVVVLTGSEIRHEYFYKYLLNQDNFEVVGIFCEGLEKSLQTTLSANTESSILERQHLNARTRSEQDFFQYFIKTVNDRNLVHRIKYGEINKEKVAQKVFSYEADLIVCFGCSIIRENFLNNCNCKIINVHLGISPYYRGSGTNVWPLIENKLDLVGATFMNMDAGIDTGEIIHQIRARVFLGDSPHTIGNRIILDMCEVYANLITNYENLPTLEQPNIHGKVFKIADFDAKACRKLYDSFNNGLIENYLNSDSLRAPILENPILL